MKKNKYQELFKCTLQKDKTDERDILFQSEININDLPEEISFIEGMPEIWNQKNIGSCQSFAFNRIYSYYNKNKFKPSSLFLYYNVREDSNQVDSDCGGSLRDTIKVANNLGICKEETYPYITEKFKEKPPTNTYIEALKNNEGKKFKYYRVTNSMQLYKAMSLGYIPYLGIIITDSFYSEKCMKTGEVPNPSSKEVGGHAIVVSYAKLNKNPTGLFKSLQSQGYFIFDNSWDVSAGNKGRFKISFETLDKMILDCWALDIDTITE